MTNETKPGIYTTEFWLLIVSNVLIQVEAIPIPDKWKWLAPIISIVGYSIARGLAKQGVPATDPVPANDAVDLDG